MPTLLGYYGYFDRSRSGRFDCSCFDTFHRDQRAIEGLPIRLVIALVVGVASLGVMMNMLSGLSGLTVTELDARPSPDVIGPDHQTIEVEVVDTDGKPVSDATVILKSGTATIDGVATATTGDDGTARVTIDPELGPNQQEGTVEVTIKPPAGSDYADERENTGILVLEDHG